MSEEEAVGLADELIRAEGLVHGGLLNAAFIPTTDPVLGWSRDTDVWLVFYATKSTLSDPGFITVEVNCKTSVAELKPGM